MGSLYSEHRSWLHGVPASAKLILLAVLGTLLYFLHSPTALMAAGTASVLLFASLGRAIAPARKLLFSVLLACALVLGFHAWMQQPLLGWVSALRLLSASLLGIALTLTTRSDELLSVFESGLRPLQRLGD